MATILQFTPAMPSRVGYEAVINTLVGEAVAVPCGKCEASGTFTALLEAQGNVRYWTSLVSSLERTRARKQLQHAREQLEFWTNKTAMYSVMRSA